MTRNPKKLILVLSANCHAVLKLFAYPSGRPFGRIINIIFPTFFFANLDFYPFYYVCNRSNSIEKTPVSCQLLCDFLSF